MKDNLYEKGVGYADSFFGIIDGQYFHIHGIKNPYYTIMFMTTYSTLDRSDNEIKRNVNRKTALFKYPRIVKNR